ncbi:MAG TPA: hypothetical protein VMF66_06915 [Candidatus Acidoferrum sp.]|nr:hypothetical protein [Candidatus Acidoferrum sp.]
MQDRLLTLSIQCDPLKPATPRALVPGATIGHGEAAGISGETLKSDGVMRDVFVKIGEDQKQLKHAIALLRIRTLHTLFEIVNDHERIGEKPLQRLCVDSLADPAALKCLVGSDKSFIQKMIQTELFGD